MISETLSIGNSHQVYRKQWYWKYLTGKSDRNEKKTFHKQDKDAKQFFYAIINWKSFGELLKSCVEARKMCFDRKTWRANSWNKFTHYILAVNLILCNK